MCCNNCSVILVNACTEPSLAGSAHWCEGASWPKTSHVISAAAVVNHKSRGWIAWEEVKEFAYLQFVFVPYTPFC